jgi:lipoate-protein ligase B
MEFETCWQLQQQRLEQIAGSPGQDCECVYLVEHPHILTLGRKGNDANVLRRIGVDGEEIPVLRINRGGDVTYHGPGQLIGYPILDLSRRNRDVHRHLRRLEAILIRCAARFGIEAFRRPGLTGVWTQWGKLASIGVGVRKWITQHGFALNVCPDLRYFDLIHPCGIAGCAVVSLSSVLARPVTLPDVVPIVAEEFGAEFQPLALEGSKCP